MKTCVYFPPEKSNLAYFFVTDDVSKSSHCQILLIDWFLIKINQDFSKWRIIALRWNNIQMRECWVLNKYNFFHKKKTIDYVKKWFLKLANFMGYSKVNSVQEACTKCILENRISENWIYQKVSSDWNFWFGQNGQGGNI